MNCETERVYTSVVTEDLTVVYLKREIRNQSNRTSALCKTFSNVPHTNLDKL